MQWVENEDWNYKTSFDLTEAERKAQNIQLKFNGLDTYAKVFLNGKLILDANNMFRIWEVSVKDLLKDKNNLLEIQFKSSPNEGKRLANLLPYKYQKVSVFLLEKRNISMVGIGDQDW